MGSRQPQVLRLAALAQDDKVEMDTKRRFFDCGRGATYAQDDRWWGKIREQPHSPMARRDLAGRFPDVLTSLTSWEPCPNPWCTPKQGETAQLNLIEGRAAPGLLLWRSDGVLGDLGDAELDHGLGLDLDRLAGLRVAAHARLAFRLHQFADAGNGELAVLLGLFDGHFSEQFQAGGCLLVGDFELLRHGANENGLGHSFCHNVLLLGSKLVLHLLLRLRYLLLPRCRRRTFGVAPC